MTHYMDGFVLPVPKKILGALARVAKEARVSGRVHGALE
jgi:uncharacterized protein YbaA (DUF1428 family)